MMRYLVVAIKSWNRRVFNEQIREYPGEWSFWDDSDELTFERVRRLSPRYIFFLHWSLRVPDEIVENFECICFHMTDVPYGRGGSPLQNLIVRGQTRTKLTALRMVRDLDAGPVYLKADLSLAGSAEEIYIRTSNLSAGMISQIIAKEPEQVNQSGDPTIFKRRNPGDSEISKCDTLDRLHDFIRMLDAEGYPNAFLIHEGYRYGFSRACLRDGRIVADVTITQEET